MRSIRIVFALAALLAIQPVFASTEDMSSSDSKSCATIADACLKEGFARADTGDKKFWQDCMKPIILGKAVAGVTVEASVVKACRKDKIAELKKELSELKKASS